MSVTERREALKEKIYALSEAHLSKAERFVEKLYQQEREARQRVEMIRSLPRIITDYPILLWGYDPCEDNSIENMWLGPNTTAVSRIRKGYPIYHGLSSSDQPLLTCHWSEILSEWSARWLDSVSIAGDVLEEYLEWLCGEAAPKFYAYDPGAPRRLRYKSSAELTDQDRERLEDYSIYRLSRERRRALEGKVSNIMGAVQDLLKERGMRLWSDEPDKSFSINREAGTIEICEASKFQRLLSPQAARAQREPDAVDWSGMSLGQIDLSGADLSGAILRGTDLSGATLKGTNLSGADLTGALLIRYDEDTDELYTADLSEARLIGACLRQTVLNDDESGETVSLAGLDLTDVDLSSTSLCDCNLSGAILKGARLDRADLSYADLSRSDLRGVDLSQIELEDLDMNASHRLPSNHPQWVPALCGAIIDAATRFPEDIDPDDHSLIRGVVA